MKNQAIQYLLMLSILFLPAFALAYPVLKVHVNNQLGKDVTTEIKGNHYFHLSASNLWNYLGDCQETVYNTENKIICADHEIGALPEDWAITSVNNVIYNNHEWFDGEIYIKDKNDKQLADIHYALHFDYQNVRGLTAYAKWEPLEIRSHDSKVTISVDIDTKGDCSSIWEWDASHKCSQEPKITISPAQ